MTRPTARVLALLEILQGGGTHAVAGLAERLGVDERTVRRYVGHLLDLDVPVESLRGRYGGYRLAPGFRMPPLMLTDDEALAILLGLVASRRAGLATASAEAAVAKVRRVLPKALAARLDGLLATIDVTARPPARSAQADGGPVPASGGPVPASGGPVPDAGVLLRLADATRQHRPVQISYVDRTGRSSERTAFPYGIVAHLGHWYVTGLDTASGEMRTLRLDRIAAVRLVPGTFEVPDGFRAADVLVTSLAATPWRHEVVVAVRGTVDEVRARLPLALATIEPDRDEWVLVRLRAERLDWLPGLLAGLGLPFVIQKPAQLRDIVRAWADRVAASAAAESPDQAAALWQ